MKLKLLSKKINSILSCVTKCLGFFFMFRKKIIFGLLLFFSLGACTAPTAMLGPAYTLTSTGNVAQAGLSYGSSEVITMYTGKTPMENIIEITSKDVNIQKQTLESEDFKNLVKTRVIKTNNILKSTNQ
jgi:hypothetical protein|tara:strand:+ start:552 stop:938 length:387 start_codon:yes stop_codon:yes gene_type:complete